MALRVLFLGENWWGSCARACSGALRRLGCDVLDVDQQTVFPQWRRRESRAALRLLRRQARREYNDRLMEAADSFAPDVLIAFKGVHVAPESLRALRGRGVALYNYFPDRLSLYVDEMAPTLPEYDCVFDTKTRWDGDTADRVRVRALEHVPHGYDPDIHRIWPADPRDEARFGCDVAFVGSYHVTKEALLARLLELRPGLDLRIWGNRWQECRIPSLRAKVQGAAVNGNAYARALRAARINLGIMGVTPEARDETSTRTYEIPASGGFMLHERTPELLELFREGREVACFEGVEELASQIDHYLAHPDEREAIAAAGHARCVPAYSYDARMARILAWHFARHGGSVDSLASGGNGGSDGNGSIGVGGSMASAASAASGAVDGSAGSTEAAGSSGSDESIGSAGSSGSTGSTEAAGSIGSTGSAGSSGSIESAGSTGFGGSVEAAGSIASVGSIEPAGSTGSPASTEAMRATGSAGAADGVPASESARSIRSAALSPAAGAAGATRADASTVTPEGA